MTRRECNGVVLVINGVRIDDGRNSCSIIIST